jgi:hypothetical protein
VAGKAKEAGGAAATAAQKAKGPVLTAGATAAGLAGGLVLGTRMASRGGGAGALLRPRRKVLGVRIGRRSGAARMAEAVAELARELSSVSARTSATTEDIRQIREQLDKANRQSPLEVVLDGLTHRRGAHKHES